MRRHSASDRRDAPVWICLGLAAATVTVYAAVGSHPFLNFDDPQYVAENPHVAGGLTPNAAAWAWRAAHAGNWHPLTWLSHMLDVELFGLDAGRHHLVSVALHAANAMLLFLAWRRLTGALWRSALVAALFAVHPTHVESVAWIAERKDVLSTLFWLLAMLAYARYGARPSPRRYALVAVAFAAGLAAKPMVVTLPFVLLLLDVWPLQRHATVAPRRLLLEKAPLVALSFAASLVTFLVQREAGAVRSLDALPVSRRLANAALGYWEYVWITVWPVDLALLYPQPGGSRLAAALIAALALAAVTAVAVTVRERHPYLLTGWGWFLGTLVPVIGLVQVGSQRIADRYTYIPTIGLFVVAAWGLPAVSRQLRLPRAAPVLTAAAMIGACAALAHAQVSRWSSSVTIWAHTVAVTRDNARAHNHLGHALAAAGRDDEARRHYDAALRLRPDYPEALNNLGALLAKRDETGAAIAAFTRAVALTPRLPHAQGNLGLALVHAGRPDDAIGPLAEAIRQDPANAELHRRLGVALTMSGRYDEAIGALKESVRLAPGDPVAHNALGAAYGSAGRDREAVAHYREAARLDPTLLEARANLGRTLLATGGDDEGKRVLHELAVTLLDAGRLEPALQVLETVLRHDPHYPPARTLLETLAARSRRAPGPAR